MMCRADDPSPQLHARPILWQKKPCPHRRWYSLLGLRSSRLNSSRFQYVGHPRMPTNLPVPGMGQMGILTAAFERQCPAHAPPAHFDTPLPAAVVDFLVDDHTVAA